jgi:hypothetical protein
MPLNIENSKSSTHPTSTPLVHPYPLVLPLPPPPPMSPPLSLANLPAPPSPFVSAATLPFPTSYNMVAPPISHMLTLTLRLREEQQWGDERQLVAGTDNDARTTDGGHRWLREHGLHSGLGQYASLPLPLPL